MPKGTSRSAQKYVVIPSSHKGEWLWQLRSKEGRILLSSRRFPTERQAHEDAREDAKRRQVISEVEYA